MAGGESGQDEYPQVDPELRTPGEIARAGNLAVPNASLDHALERLSKGRLSPASLPHAPKRGRRM